MYEIMRLSGQEYVDQYAATVKAKAKAAAGRPSGGPAAPGGRRVPATGVPEPTEQELAQGKELLEAAAQEHEEEERGGSGEQPPPSAG